MRMNVFFIFIFVIFFIWKFSEPKSAEGIFIGYFKLYTAGVTRTKANKQNENILVPVLCETYALG